ncbi:TonB-dependent receptor [Roseivirga misakiensis]|nr:TonB-dependent receptor [Roseivirga misakiensis]
MQKGIRYLILLMLFSVSMLTYAQNTKEVMIGDPSKTSTGRARVQGKITSKEDKQALFGATVAVKGTNIGGVSDENGNYEFSIAPGRYEFIFQFVGKETITYNVQVVGNGRLDVTLVDASVDLDEVLIEGEAEDQNVQRISAGVNRLNIKEIESLPAFMGEVDVVKSLQSLPGVSTVGEGASGFNVRGGRTDQNLILQDGAILFNASHVLGFFSTFNPDATETFSLYKGNMPAQYGGRISSVLDVTMKEGNSEKVKVRGGLGMVASRLVVDGPLNGGRTRFLVAGRSSYSDWVLSQARNFDVQNSAARFHDVNLKLSHRFGTKNKLTASYYRSGDFFRFTQDFGFEWDSDIFNFNWQSSITDKLISSTRFVKGVYKSTLFDPSGIDAAEVANGMDYYQANQTFFYNPSDKHNINFGVDFVRYDGLNETATPIGPDSGIPAETVFKEQGNEYGFFVNDEITLTKDLALSVGLRYSMFENRGPYDVFQYADGAQRLVENITDTISYGEGDVIARYDGFEPRIGLRFKIDEESSIKASVNRTRQYIHTLSNSTAATPTDILQLSNSYLKPLVSNNASIGYFKNFKDNLWETSVEAYIRDIDNLLDYKDFVDLLLNNHLETDLLAGKGRAYGLELYVKKNRGAMTGWLSYTLSRTEIQIEGENLDETINNGEWYPANFDRTHNFSWVSKVQLRGQSSFNWNVVYSTGRPINGIVTNYRIGSTVVPHFSERNEFRIPDYFRIDLSFTFGRDILKAETRKKLEGRNYSGTLTIGIYNILSRKNAFSVFFRRPDDLSLIPRPHRLTVLGAAFPNITYNFKF